MTPNFAVIAIETPEWRMPRLWIPLFLLWLPVLLLSPLIFLLLVAIAIATQNNIWRLLSVFWSIASSLPGTHVHVAAEGNRILVRLL
jgi:hypothetical protein